MTSISYSPSAPDAGSSGATTDMDSNIHNEELLIDNSESFAKGMRNKLRSFSQDQHLKDGFKDAALLKRNSTISKAESLTSFKTASGESEKSVDPIEHSVSNTNSIQHKATLSSPSIKRSTSIKRSPSLISAPRPSAPVAASATIITTNAVGTLSKNENNIKDTVADIVTDTKPTSKPAEDKVEDEFNEDFNNQGLGDSKPKKTNFNDNIMYSNSTPVDSKPICSTDSKMNRSNQKRRSFFGLSNKSNTSSNNISSISAPVLLSEEQSSPDSKLKVPEALQQVQQQQKQLYGDVQKKYIPTQNNRDSDQKLSRMPSRKPSSNSLFDRANLQQQGSAATTPTKSKKAKNSLMSFFKYKKSMSSNNLNSSLRSGNGLYHQKAASNLDLHSAYRNDSFSISSVDNHSLSSNATTRTSISTFKKNVFNKLRNKNSSSSSIFGRKSQRNIIDHSDAVSVRTSNTANFNYAIANMAIQEDRRNESHETPTKTRSNLTTPKRNPNNNVYSPGDSTIRRNTPSSHSKKSSVSNNIFNTPRSSASSTSRQPPEGPADDLTPTFDEGDVLFPKSLDINEVKSIVDIERKLSTRSVKRGDSVNRKNRASIEVKAKEDGMIVEFGKDVNEPPPVGLKKTNSILKNKPKKNSVDDIIKEEKETSNEDIKEEKETSNGDIKEEKKTSNGDIGENVSNHLMANIASAPKIPASSPSTNLFRSSVGSAVDFGINFSDTKLDLDFPEFQSSYTSDDVSSKSFELGDENIHAVSRKDNVSPKINSALNQSARTPNIVNNKTNTGVGFRFNNFVKGRLNKNNSSSDLTKTSETQSVPLQQAPEIPPQYNNNAVLEPPIIEITSSKPNNVQTHRRQNPSTSSTISNRSTLSHNNPHYQGSQPQHQHRRNNLSSSSYLPISGSSNSLNTAVSSSRRIGNRSVSRPTVKFSSRIILYETYNPEDYDRHPEIATCNQLTPLLAQQIKEDINAFKAEMPIHEESRCNTHFY